MAIIVGDSIDQRCQVVAVRLHRLDDDAPFLLADLPDWLRERCAAAIIEAGMRTEALLPHFFTMTRMLPSERWQGTGNRQPHGKWLPC